MTRASATREPRELELRGTQGKVFERQVEVVTLVHGGGAVSSEENHRHRPTRKPDPVTPLRGSAVRGQLRFFWRATSGCTVTSLEELREREDALWGKASKPGVVDLRIDQQKLTRQDVNVESLGDVGTGLRYGAFASANLTRLRGKATLRLLVGRIAGGAAHEAEEALARHAAEVELALTAWLLFGGIGGRTRRGFGAVSAAALPDPRDFVAGLAGRPIDDRVPALRDKGNVVLSRATFGTAEEAHQAAIDALRRFRQGAGVGRNPGQGKRLGRSRWPEPDAIRRKVGRYPERHAPVHPVAAFPRGVFGMPIVFHFMGDGEPETTQLIPAEDVRRMASPLILRPARIGERWHAMAARLVVRGVDHGVLVPKLKNPSARIGLLAGEGSRISPLAAQGGNPDVIAAFLDYFRA